MKIRLRELKRLLREEFKRLDEMCMICGQDHAGEEPYWHDDNDAMLNPDHWNDEQPHGYQYKDPRDVP